MTASPIEALKGGFRRACVRRLVGDEQGAVAVLRISPRLVISWSKTTSLEASERKLNLKRFLMMNPPVLMNWPWHSIYLLHVLKDGWLEL